MFTGDARLHGFVKMVEKENYSPKIDAVDSREEPVLGIPSLDSPSHFNFQHP